MRCRGAADRSARGVVEAGIPALAVLIEATDDGRLTLTTTDLEVSARLATDAQVSEPGIALVPARLLGDTVKSLSDAPVDVETDQSQAHIRCAAYEGTLRLLPAEDFPGLQEPSGTKITTARVAGGDQVARGASRDDTRPVLTGVLIEAAVRACDGGDRLVPAAVRELWRPPTAKARRSCRAPE
jgi:DNA polymerase-3 subunit beta